MGYEIQLVRRWSILSQLVVQGGLFFYWFIRWFKIDVFVDGSVGRVPGFNEFTCMMSFGVASDFSFIPVEKMLFTVGVIGN